MAAKLLKTTERMLSLFALLLSGSAVTIPAAGSTSAAEIAFVDVNLLPMDAERALTHQTVIVRNSRIAQFGDAGKLSVPKTAFVVDGRGRFLMPGLTDFHVHLADSAEDQVDELKLFVANGITRAVNMRGTPAILKLREQLRSGAVMGPTLLTAGPYLNEPEFTTPEEVRREVIRQKNAGYDFIKIHGELSAGAYDALIETAREQKIRVVGHVPVRLGIDAVLGRQALVVHAEEYLYSYFQRNRELPGTAEETMAMARQIAERTASSGTWFSATLATFREIIFQVSDIDAVLDRPAMRYVPPDIAATWMPDQNVYVKRWKIEKVPYFRAQYQAMRTLTKAMSDAGVPMLVGTDCLVSGVIPGFAMQDELDDLAGAGLTPWRVLRAATWNAAVFLGISDRAGRIRVGADADLLLLSANPLEDISNVSRRAGVMLHGRWFSEDDLQHELSAVARKYAK